MSSLSMQYKVGITQQVIQALRKVFNSPEYPDQELAQKINIENEYPIVQTRYPTIYVVYRESGVHDSGLGNFTVEPDPITTKPNLVRQWIFEGDVVFNIMALDPLERDTLSASLADLFAFGKDMPEFQAFYDEIYDEDFVSLQLLTSALTPGGMNVVPAPWGNTNELIYINSYGAKAIGSFFTTPNNSSLIQIRKVIPMPYTPDQNPPIFS